jgi:GNAT superfamily N-acetyltransferase
MLRLFLVEPVYRGRGIGDKLLQAAIEHAANADIQRSNCAPKTFSSLLASCTLVTASNFS